MCSHTYLNPTAHEMTVTWKKKKNTKTTNLLELCMMNESMIASWKRKTEVPLLSLSADKPLSQF